MQIVKVRLLLPLVLAGCWSEAELQRHEAQQPADAGAIASPADAGAIDAGSQDDAGAPEADAGPGFDAGPPVADAGHPVDAGTVFGTGTAHYAATNGTAAGDGSEANPWDLETALRQPAALQPGDTLWVRGGTYSPSGAELEGRISGTAQAPIVVRAYPGERATLGASLFVYGSYTWYWGLEITEAASWTRTTSECGSFANVGAAHDGVYLTQGVTGCKLINLVIHDTAGGIGDQQEATGTELYGNVIYDVGWSSSCDRGHGHGLYVQNNTSGVTKNFVDNVVFNSFDIGIQAYGGAPPITHLHFAGNVAFNAGLPYGHRVDNLVVAAGSAPKEDITLDGDVFYNPLDAASDNTGYNDLVPTWDGAQNVDLTIRNAIWVGAPQTGYMTLLLRGWQSVTFKNNVVVGPLVVQNVSTFDWANNTYWSSAPPAGVDTASAQHAGTPSGATVRVRPNRYEPGRANVTVLNWSKATTVQVDLSGAGLAMGDAFEVIDVQNYFGPPVYRGVYTGQPIALPMNGTAVASMQYFATTPPHTSPELGVFVVRR